MVKNIKGGSKTKKQARKSMTIQDESSIKTRFSSDPDELYACCSKLLGNGMCMVLCIDSNERLCVIRNKFRGKGKRGNIIETGTWCLVGRRAFETSKEGKLEKTDLLEVYGEIEKKQIMQKEVGYTDRWKIFTNLGSSIHEQIIDDDIISFQRVTEMPDIIESDDSEDIDENENENENENTYTNTMTIKHKVNDGLGETVDIDDI
jgi:hypothetical protein